MHANRLLAELLEVPAERDVPLNEVSRPLVADDGAFREAVQSYLNGGSLTGREAREAVVQRMESAVADALDIGLVGLVSHGSAISLLLEHLGVLRARGFWMRLASPDAWLIEGCTIRWLEVRA